MQLKSPVNPSASPTPPFLAVNGSSGGGAQESGASAGAGSAFARLMESQAGDLAKATLPVAPPPALSADAKETTAAQRNGAPLNGGNPVAGSGNSGGSKPADQRTPAAHGAQDSGKALNQQQAERNRLNAQREARTADARSTAARAASSSAANAAQATKAANAGPAKEAGETQGASAEEEDKKPEGDNASTPLALLNLINNACAVEARQSASSGQGQLSEEAKQALAAQEAAAATGLPAQAASATLPPGTAAGGVLPPAPGADAPVDPLAAGLPTAAHASAKPLHHGLAPAQQDANSSSSTQGKGGEAAGGIALHPAMAAAQKELQQAELTALAAGGANGASGNSRGAPGTGGVDALGAGGFAAALHQHAAAAQDVGAPVSVDVPTPVQSPEFKEALGAQVSLLARDGVQSAELHLNPADMGPISVQITLDGTQARVDFGADSASTRQLIESGLPELASALRDAGLTLSGGGVSQHAPQQQQGRGDASGSGEGRRGGGGDSGSPDPLAAPVRSTAAARRVALGGVDVYA